MACIRRCSFLAGIWAVCLLAAFQLAGCGRGSATRAAASSKAFDKASPEIKAQWDKVAGAVSSNDYATAILTCRKLLGPPGLTGEQIAAVNDAMTAENNRMTAAAEKGDPNALKAIEEIRAHWQSN